MQMSESLQSMSQGQETATGCQISGEGGVLPQTGLEGEGLSIKSEAKPAAASVRHESPTKRNLLGDFTIYRINKEFENFWAECSE